VHFPGRYARHDEACVDAPCYDPALCCEQQVRLFIDDLFYSRSPGDRRAWVALARSTAVALV
jgi:hypothetical protein